MTLRLDYLAFAPDICQKLFSVGTAFADSPLEQELIELVYLRVSQLNGCAFCLAKHSAALRDRGVQVTKLDQLSAWPVTDIFSRRERAALAWAECLTQIAETAAPDKDFDRLKEEFTDKEITDLTLAIAHMNALNRVAIAMRQ